jgi:ubiquinone biosynthesis accessory factor UbiK
MIDENKIDSMIREIFRNLPEELKQTRKDIEKNLKAALHSTFSKMDLVTREEFEVQAELLSRTRAMLDEMEQKVAALEQKLSRK